MAGPKKANVEKKRNILEMSLDEYNLKGSNKKINKKGQQREPAGDKRRRKGGFKTLNAAGGKNNKHQKRASG